MNTGEYIKQLRLQRGLTLEELGNKVGVGKSTVRKWETGAIANMRRDKLQKLAEALGVNPLEIIEYDVKKQPTPKDELSPDEAMLLDLFRRIPEADRPLVLQMIRAALNTRK